MKSTWYKRKDGTHVRKVGRYKVLEIFKRPHGGWCCFVYHNGEYMGSEGYFACFLPKKHDAVRWGCKNLKEIKNNG